jgi:hypothetical protein
MSQSVLHALIGGGGVAGVWVACFMLRLVAPYWVVKDKDDQITELKAAIDSQTRRADVAQETAHQANLILAGLRQEARVATPLDT